MAEKWLDCYVGARSIRYTHTTYIHNTYIFFFHYSGHKTQICFMTSVVIKRKLQQCREKEIARRRFPKNFSVWKIVHYEWNRNDYSRVSTQVCKVQKNRSCRYFLHFASLPFLISQIWAIANSIDKHYSAYYYHLIALFEFSSSLTAKWHARIHWHIFRLKRWRENWNDWSHAIYHIKEY